MRFVIFTSGSIDHSIWSSVSGEGRWALNLANVIANRMPGSTIDLIGGSQGLNRPVWGVMPPLKNIYLKGEHEINPGSPYDIALYVPWETKMGRPGNWMRCKHSTNFIKAKLYVHCTFSWTTGIIEFPCHREGHILAYPFAESGGTFQGTEEVNKFAYERLSYPHGWEYSVPDFSRREIVWSSKDAFHPEWKTRNRHIAKAALDTMNALVRICKKHDIQKIHFFTGTRIMDPKWNPFVEEWKLDSIVAKLPNPQIHDWLRYDQVGEIMRASKISVPICGLASSMTEAICNAALPITYQGHPNCKSARELGLEVNQYEVTEDSIYEHMDLLLSDEALYKKATLAYQEDMKDHTISNVVKQLEGIFAKYLK